MSEISVSVFPSEDESRELSFSEILDQSPPSSTKNEQIATSTEAPVLRRQSSRAGLLGRFGLRRNSILKRDGPERGHSTRGSLSTESLNRKSSLYAQQVTKEAEGPSRNASYGGAGDAIIKPTSPTLSSPKKERVSRMASDPPPLGSAYSQSVKHGTILAPAGSVDAILRTHKTNGHSKKASTDITGEERRPSTALGNDAFMTKIYVLTNTGYFLQYAGEGNYDRMPEVIMQLSSSSAAIACDAIPGKHWVLHVSATFTEGPQQRSRFGLSKLGLGGPKSGSRNFLLIMESANEMDAWLVALRREIQALGGADYKPDVTDERTSEEKSADLAKKTLPERASMVVQQPPKRPTFNRAGTAPDKVVTHRLTASMANQGLLLRMDEDKSDDETEVSVSATITEGPQGFMDDMLSRSHISISDMSSYYGKPSVETVAAPSAPTGRRKSESRTQQTAQARASADLDNVMISIIPKTSSQSDSSSRPEISSLERRYTGLRKKGSIIMAQKTSPSTDAPQIIATEPTSNEGSNKSSGQPLSAGFKRLSPVGDLGPIILTPPESPEVNVRPRSMSMIDQEDGEPLSPKSASLPLQSPLSEPGMLSPYRVWSDSMSFPATASSTDSANNSKTTSPASTENVSVNTMHTTVIPPRQSSLVYAASLSTPGSGPSSGRSTPSSTVKESITTKTEKLKSKLAALDVVNLPASNALLLGPSPHLPPTTALPELPTNKSPGPSRPASRQGQSRKPSVVSMLSERSSSEASMRRPSEIERAPSVASTASTVTVTATVRRLSDDDSVVSLGSFHGYSNSISTSSMHGYSNSISTSSMHGYSNSERSTTPDPVVALPAVSSPVEQVAPRKPRIEKVILPPMSEVPALTNGSRAPLQEVHEQDPHGPYRYTVAERRRRRSPSPVHMRGRSQENAEKVLSAISEMTEASEGPVRLDEMITIGFEPTAEEYEGSDGDYEEEPAKEKVRPDSNLLPNGMPNPLAGNPVRTPDMKMIPHKPDQAPPMPSMPAKFTTPAKSQQEAPARPKRTSSIQNPSGPSREEELLAQLAPLAKPVFQRSATYNADGDGKSLSADVPKLARKPSMKERATAALAAARAAHGHGPSQIQGKTEHVVPKALERKLSGRKNSREHNDALERKLSGDQINTLERKPSIDLIRPATKALERKLSQRNGSRDKILLPSNPKAMKQGHVKKSSVEAVLAPSIPKPQTSTLASGPIQESSSTTAVYAPSLPFAPGSTSSSTSSPASIHPPRSSSVPRIPAASLALATPSPKTPAPTMAASLGPLLNSSTKPIPPPIPKHIPMPLRPISANSATEKEVRPFSTTEKELRPFSTTEKEVMIPDDGLPNVTLSPFQFTNPPIDLSHSPPVPEISSRQRHIAEILFIPELPAEPPTPAAPVMQASITGFGEDDLDMWAWQVGEAQRRPVSMLPPLHMMGKGRGFMDEEEKKNVEGDGEEESDLVKQRREKENGKVENTRWSLFNAIEKVQ